MVACKCKQKSCPNQVACDGQKKCPKKCVSRPKNTTKMQKKIRKYKKEIAVLEGKIAAEKAKFQGRLLVKTKRNGCGRAKKKCLCCQ